MPTDMWITGTCPECQQYQETWGKVTIEAIHTICGCCKEHCPCVPKEEQS